jgi:hypothetical protein
MGGTGHQPREIAALQAHNADRIEPFGHQQSDIIERHPGEGRGMVAIRELGESFLQGAAERGLS